MIATQSSNKLSNLKKDYSADKSKIYLINTFDSEKIISPIIGEISARIRSPS